MLVNRITAGDRGHFVESHRRMTAAEIVERGGRFLIRQGRRNTKHLIRQSRRIIKNPIANGSDYGALQRQTLPLVRVCHPRSQLAPLAVT
jgi:hypothetical protein